MTATKTELKANEVDDFLPTIQLIDFDARYGLYICFDAMQTALFST